jgi:Zn-dependent protease/predicted transcriptional regulator
MRWSLQIARVAGIGIYIHWTFLILPAWIIIESLNDGAAAREIIGTLVFVMALFGCVILHELGHALTAKHYGIVTRDITLLPIGGVARMERIPEEPKQELLVALAGPAVNVVIAAVLAAILFATGRLHDLSSQLNLEHGPFLVNLMVVNVMLVAFNLLPAFPMDGGRVLRALLATRLPYARATQIAATIGQGMAVMFGIAGFLSGQWPWLFIALFVYIGAQEEAHMAQMRTVFRGVPARDAMMTRFVALPPGVSVQSAAEELLKGYQQDFPVVEADQLLGILTRQDLFKALAAGKADQSVAEIMHRDCPIIEETAMLDAVVPLLRNRDCSTIAVMKRGRLAGLLNGENISEWMMIRTGTVQAPKPLL